MGFTSIIETIDSLPPLPDTVQKLEQLFSEGDPDTKELVKIIESDPLLTANILVKANAPIYSFSKQIVSVMQAVALLGLTAIRGMVLASFIERNFDIDMSPYGISNDQYAQLSTIHNTLMFQWFIGVDIEKAKLLTPIAFLMEIGKVLIANAICEDDATELFQNILQQTGNIEETERIFTNMTSTQISGLLFEHWYFDNSFAACMKYLDTPDAIPPDMEEMIHALEVIRTAANIKEQLSESSIDEAALLAETKGFDKDKFILTAMRIKKKFML